jgi:hypothetical protein
VHEYVHDRTCRFEMVHLCVVQLHVAATTMLPMNRIACKTRSCTQLLRPYSPRHNISFMHAVQLSLLSPRT